MVSDFKYFKTIRKWLKKLLLALTILENDKLAQVFCFQKKMLSCKKKIYISFFVSLVVPVRGHHRHGQAAALIQHDWRARELVVYWRSKRESMKLDWELCGGWVGSRSGGGGSRQQVHRFEAPLADQNFARVLLVLADRAAAAPKVEAVGAVDLIGGCVEHGH